MHELEQIAIEVATACGQLILDERPHQVQVADTKSSDVDVVTIMDTRSEERAWQLLNELRPDDGLYGEEGLDIPTKTGITWVIDPIDGTVNYLYDIPNYAVSVAAVEGDPHTPGAWRPIAGAVVNPKLGEVFHAAQGTGAKLTCPGNIRELRPNPPTELAASMLGTGFAYIADTRIWQGQLFAQLIGQVRDMRRMGSAALDLCNVAVGRLDVYYEYGLNPWDMAAGWLIAAEAGLTVRGLNEAYPSRTMTLVGIAPVLDELGTQISSWLDTHQIELVN